MANRSRRRNWELALACSCIVIAITANAQTGSQPAPARVGITGERDLSLSDAVAEALASNIDIAVARTSSEQAVLTTAGAFGAFDPQFSVQSTLVRQVTPIATLIAGTDNGRLTSQDLLFGPRVQGLSPRFGTNYQLSFTSRRQTTDNTFVLLNPQFPTTLAFNITQPLFRGRRVDQARLQVEVSKKSASLTDAQLRQRVMDVTLQVEQAYWDLVFARANADVQASGLALARQQVASSQRLVDQGVAAPIDVVEAETQVAALTQQVLATQTALTRAENALKVLLAPGRSAPIWSVGLKPTTDAGVLASEPTLEEALQSALANRPEIQQLTITASTNATRTDFFRDQTRPQVDLVGSYTSSGLAGQTALSGPNPFTAGFAPLFDRINTLSLLQDLQPIPVVGGGGNDAAGVPPALRGGVGQSLSGLAKQDFPTVEVGLRVSLPFHDRTAEANLASSLVEGRRLQLLRQQLENAIEADVRNVMQAVASARASLAAATEASGLAEQQYGSEQRKFDAGTSTVFLVLQRQTALIASRSQRARAESELSKSLAALNRATGRILDAHRISVK